MSRAPAQSRLLLGAVALLAAAPAFGGDDVRVHTDAAGDATIRRTDAQNNCPLGPGCTLPDLLEARLMGWTTPTPTTDPYNGAPRQGRGANLFRLDVKFAGLLNPPGTLGAGGTAFDPFAFGPSPVFGFLELDMDRDRDTGGELGGSAHSRYLANVGRFGRMPEGSISGRVARWSDEVDTDFATAPQIERSGADWALTLCGCNNVTVISEGGNANGVFDAGETWVVRSRFFKRSGGYQGASGMFGGSAPGLYDPPVNLRFAHDVQSNTTTISLVWALNAAGAAALTGQTQQAYDQSIAAGSHASVAEGLRDLIIAAQGGNGGPLIGPVHTLTNGWADESHNDEQLLDPTRWRVAALFGTACADAAALYVWTDTGFEDTFGDCNADGDANTADYALLDGIIEANDGGPRDLDGVVNGRVLVGLGGAWSFYDLNADGVIDDDDLDMLIEPAEECPADWNRDGQHNTLDVFAFLTSWFAGHADFDGDGHTTLLDLFAYLNTWFGGCP
ncbi:MAG: hypothetical protein KF869_04280 [Phycisphaeraceae bacterium]|nr:hypothetical protein [Phycisphaeraceae bacterium]